jgi:hypothetical protein
MDLLKRLRKPDYFVLRYAKPEKRNDPQYKWYAFEPNVIYPVTVKRIQEVVASREIPGELVDSKPTPGVDPYSVAINYANWAKALPDDAWTFALKTRDSFILPQEITLRAEALNLARLWFTQALSVAVGEAVGVHILNDERYKL